MRRKHVIQLGLKSTFYSVLLLSFLVFFFAIMESYIKGQPYIFLRKFFFRKFHEMGICIKEKEVASLLEHCYEAKTRDPTDFKHYYGEMNNYFSSHRTLQVERI